LVAVSNCPSSVTLLVENIGKLAQFTVLTAGYVAQFAVFPTILDVIDDTIVDKVSDFTKNVFV
jgi:hypothetical protein